MCHNVRKRVTLTSNYIYKCQKSVTFTKKFFADTVIYVLNYEIKECCRVQRSLTNGQSEKKNKKGPAGLKYRSGIYLN